MLVVKCGCGSTALSPVSTDQFKRLFLMLVSYQSSLESPCEHQFKKVHCALEVSSFLFLCNLTLWKSSDLVCPLFSLYTNKSSQCVPGVTAALIAPKNGLPCDSRAFLEVSLCVSCILIWWGRKWEECWERATGLKCFVFFCVYCTYKILYINPIYIYIYKKKTVN